MPTQHGTFFQHANFFVDLAHLRGSHVEGHHQDVMLRLTNGTWIRISRNNASDTFQIGADPGIGDGMNLLFQWPVAVGTTAREALQAFGDVHNLWPEYHHADCQVFARAVYDRLTQVPAQFAQPVDDFM